MKMIEWRSDLRNGRAQIVDSVIVHAHDVNQAQEMIEEIVMDQHPDGEVYPTVPMPV